MKQKISTVILLIVLLHCTNNQLSGGSTNTTNAKVCGVIVHQDNLPAQGTVVFLIPSDYMPLNSAYNNECTVLIDTTDTSGNYSFSDITTGHYTIDAVHLFKRTRLFVGNIQIDSSNHESNRIDTLKPVTKLYISIPDTLGSGYIYLTGTIDKFLCSNGSIVEIDSVAQGQYSDIRFIKKSADPPVILYSNVNVSTSESIVISPFMQWQNIAKVIINTSSDGANISENIIGFPLLIRLNSKNFDFTTTQPGGTDLRFSKADGTPLNFQIENWNSLNGKAAVWVSIDTVYGTNRTQFIYMYWGNQSVKTLSNGNDVFDTSLGYQGVWHMDGDGSGIVYDATANRYHGTAINMPGGSYTEGIAGDAREFDGKSQYVQIMRSANSKLNFPEYSSYTVSGWAYLDTLDTLYHTIVGKGWLQYQMEKLKTSDWEFTEYKSEKGWEVTTSAAQSGVWALVTGVRKGTRQYLYVNGICTDSIPDIWDLSGSTDNSFDVTIGNLLGDVVENRTYLFDGKIDEIRILDRACSPNWIKLCYMSQVQNGTMISILKQ